MAGFERDRYSPTRPSHTEGNVKHEQRWIILATEGRITEKAYFDQVNDEYRSVRVAIVTPEKQDDNSDPKYVVEMLDDISENPELLYSESGAEFQIEKHDQLWAVIDVDDRSEKLDGIANQCAEKGYYLAVSNPCFELWLLLHLYSLDDYTRDEADQFLGEFGPDNIKEHLKEKVGFNHKKPNFAPFLKNERIQLAIDRARQIDDLNERWPHNLGSRIYQIVEQILA